ncbi:hypothetical protein IWQ56_007302, partial [Coemansia nantahalensis]
RAPTHWRRRQRRRRRIERLCIPGAGRNRGRPRGGGAPEAAVAAAQRGGAPPAGRGQHAAADTPRAVAQDDAGNGGGQGAGAGRGERPGAGHAAGAAGRSRVVAVCRGRANGSRRRGGEPVDARGDGRPDQRDRAQRAAGRGDGRVGGGGAALAGAQAAGAVCGERAADLCAHHAGDHPRRAHRRPAARPGHGHAAVARSGLFRLGAVGRPRGAPEQRRCRVPVDLQEAGDPGPQVRHPHCRRGLAANQPVAAADPDAGVHDARRICRAGRVRAVPAHAAPRGQGMGHAGHGPGRRGH